MLYAFLRCFKLSLRCRAVTDRLREPVEQNADWKETFRGNAMEPHDFKSNSLIEISYALALLSTPYSKRPLLGVLTKTCIGSGIGRVSASSMEHAIVPNVLTTAGKLADPTLPQTTSILIEAKTTKNKPLQHLVEVLLVLFCCFFCCCFSCCFFCRFCGVSAAVITDASSKALQRAKEGQQRK